MRVLPNQQVKNFFRTGAVPLLGLVQGDTKLYGPESGKCRLSWLQSASWFGGQSEFESECAKDRPFQMGHTPVDQLKD